MLPERKKFAFSDYFRYLFSSFNFEHKRPYSLLISLNILFIYSCLILSKLLTFSYLFFYLLDSLCYLFNCQFRHYLFFRLLLLAVDQRKVLCFVDRDDAITEFAMYWNKRKVDKIAELLHRRFKQVGSNSILYYLCIKP